MIIEQGEYLHLQGKNISYILRIHKAGYLLHHYFGKKLRPNDYTSYPAWHRSFYTYNSDKVFLEGECQEYPTFGYIDLKLPALKASEKGKTAIFSFKYKRHEIKEGKPDLPGLPSSKANGANSQTLIVVLSDEAYGVELELSYTVFDDSDIIARSVKIINAGKDMLRLEKVFSCSLVCFSQTHFRKMHICIEQIFFKFSHIVDLRNRYNGEFSKVRIYHDRLRIGIADYTYTRLASEFWKFRFKLGAKIRTFQTMNRTNETFAFRICCHTGTFRT